METEGIYPLVKRDDYVRLLIQALNDLGYQLRFYLPRGPGLCLIILSSTGKAQSC